MECLSFTATHFSFLENNSVEENNLKWPGVV